ncbi:hypothetical protein CPB83DRAFT_884932 [Crepidotus variabilis]|uniref:Uncharacterized protein n=1 Tax=Crepidotus variabilis TaxID=179855 RepID=A0A9P6EBG9_9AGAR|nr:hypothetical protein CPB83DRAFT_884932 [Crepidotus variabilis]
MLKLITSTVLISAATLVIADHTFVLHNQCNYRVNPKIVNVNCGYSPRCDVPGSGGVPNPAVSYTGPQPRTLGVNGDNTNMTVNRDWNGRIFHQTGKCGAKGESCTMAEFNLDTGGPWSQQSYDISNIQGFTMGMKIEVNDGVGPAVTCSNIYCGCLNAYPPGTDFSGCGNDWPVKGTSGGDKIWTVTFCA